MEIIKLEDLLEGDQEKERLLVSLKRGEIIIYPTDTVYGIGCNIEKEDSVKRIIEAKQRDPKKPLSIIAPSVDWILENCQVSEFNKSLLNQLFPGPYSAVLKVKPDSKIPKYLQSSEKTIGVRMPRHQLTDLIRESGLVIITTSLNISGQQTITKIEEVPESLQKITFIAIDAGQLGSESSRVFDLTSDDIQILRW